MNCMFHLRNLSWRVLVQLSANLERHDKSEKKLQTLINSQLESNEYKSCMREFT